MQQLNLFYEFFGDWEYYNKGGDKWKHVKDVGLQDDQVVIIFYLRDFSVVEDR